MSVTTEISELLQKGNARMVAEKTRQALDEGIDAGSVLNDGLIAGMSIIGSKFKNNEIYVPEVMMAAKAMGSGLDVLKPILEKSGVKPLGKVIIGTVKGDLHDIGKNLVGMMMVGAGLEVIDLGKDVSAEKFVQAVKEHKAGVVVLSALLTTTMMQQKKVIDTLIAAGLRERVKVMVGGAPVTQAFAEEIGADAYTSDAASAAEKASEFVQRQG